MLATQQIFLFASLLCLIAFLVLLSVATGGVPGMRELLLASVLGMAANALYAFGRHLPPPLACEVANVVYGAAGAALVAGYRRMTAYPPREAVLAASVVALGVLVAVFHYVLDSAAGRGALVSLFQLAVCAGVAHTVLAPRARWPLTPYGRHFVLAVCALAALGHAGLAAWPAGSPVPALPLLPAATDLVLLSAAALALPALALGGLLVAHRHIVQRTGPAANHDFLTNAPSRNVFFELAARELAVSRRSGRTLALALFHVGSHESGDAALRLVVDAAGAALRGGDCLARLGGDEFALLLPDTTLAGATAAGEKLQAAVRRAFAGSPAMTGQQAPTLAVGVTTVGRNEEFRDAMARADEALHEAKAAGRSGVAARAHGAQVALAFRAG